MVLILLAACSKYRLVQKQHVSDNMEHIEATELNTGDNGNTFIDLWLGRNDSGFGEVVSEGGIQHISL